MNDDIFNQLDIDEEALVTGTSVNILVDSITDQFNNAFDERRRDYIQTFITRYKILKDQLYGDDLEDLENERDTYYKAVIDLFEEKLGIGFPEIVDQDEESQNDTLQFTYNFFIRKIKRNFKNIIYNYIVNFEEDITAKYEKKKDVTTLHLKAEIDNEYDILVLSHLSEIVNDALYYAKNLDDVLEFLKMCEGDEELLELTFVQAAYMNFEITGNFISNYIDMFNDNTHEIHSKIRNKILKKYPNRKVDKDEKSTHKIDLTSIDGESEDIDNSTSEE